MEPVMLIVAAAGGAAGAAVLVYTKLFNRKARNRRAIRRLTTVPVGEAREGVPVKIQGRVRPIVGLLVAPLSRRRCVAWHVTVEEEGSRSSRELSAAHLEDQKSVDFLLEDDTGRALVKGAWLDLALVDDARFASGTFSDASPELEAFLEAHGQSSRGMLLNRTLAYREAVLEEGEQVTAVGIGAWELDPDGAPAGTVYRDAARRLVLDCLEDGRLLVSDDPRTMRK